MERVWYWFASVSSNVSETVEPLARAGGLVRSARAASSAIPVPAATCLEADAHLCLIIKSAPCSAFAGRPHSPSLRSAGRELRPSVTLHDSPLAVLRARCGSRAGTLARIWISLVAGVG